MVSKDELIKLLNKALQDELAATFQYMWHHFQGQGIESEAILPVFKKHSIDEMKHAEALAERIVYLGGTPNHLPSAMSFGGDLRKMMQDDLALEEAAIAYYKQVIAKCGDDPTTRRLLESILADEEEHADTWQTLLAR